MSARQVSGRGRLAYGAVSYVDEALSPEEDGRLKSYAVVAIDVAMSRTA